MLPAHAGLVRLFEAAAEGIRMDPRRQCDRSKQEKSSLAHVHRSLHYKWLTDPRYEQVISRT
jgi:hypothetical protein